MRKNIGNKLYGDIPILQENPVDIYISSSWIDDGNWMWGIVDQAFTGMLKMMALFCLHLMKALL